MERHLKYFRIAENFLVGFSARPISWLKTVKLIYEYVWLTTAIELSNHHLQSKFLLPPFGQSMAMCKRTIFLHSPQTKERQLILVSTTSPPFDHNRTLRDGKNKRRFRNSNVNRTSIELYSTICIVLGIVCVEINAQYDECMHSYEVLLVGHADQAVGTTHRQPYVWHKPNYITMNRKKRKKKSVQTFISIVVRSSEIRKQICMETLTETHMALALAFSFFPSIRPHIQTIEWYYVSLLWFLE